MDWRPRGILLRRGFEGRGCVHIYDDGVRRIGVCGGQGLPVMGEAGIAGCEVDVVVSGWCRGVGFSGTAVAREEER